MPYISRFLKTLQQLLNDFYKPISIVTVDTSCNLNMDLVNLIYTVTSVKNLESIVFSPINKLYIVNVYYSTFEELLDKLLEGVGTRSISSVNINAYFVNKVDITYRLKRLIPILQSNKLVPQVEYDLYEILQGIEIFVTMNMERSGG